jgi:Domain of Unknown Function with PDB structure (DUF3857)
MKHVVRVVAVAVFSFAVILTRNAGAADWPPISPEDMKMTRISEQPGAAAVILYREEVDDDMNNVESAYERIKILTEAGREYANVELPYSRRGFRIDGISGRTVHADGSIAEFVGKPFDKTVVRGGDLKINVKSFTLPDVQVGSIIDYRYSLRYEDNMVLPPLGRFRETSSQRRHTSNSFLFKIMATWTWFYRMVRSPRVLPGRRLLGVKGNPNYIIYRCWPTFQTRSPFGWTSTSTTFPHLLKSPICRRRRS